MNATASVATHRRQLGRLSREAMDGHDGMLREFWWTLGVDVGPTSRDPMTEVDSR